MSSAPRLSWWLIAGEVFLLAVLSSLGAWLMFSLLPVSAAVIVSIAAITTFPFVRCRLRAWNHVLYVSTAWFALGIFCLFLIQWLGREHFEWLLDWG